MTQIEVQLGTPTEVGVAVAVYERANLVRRHGVWPSRSARVAQVMASLHDPATWILIGRDGGEPWPWRTSVRSAQVAGPGRSSRARRS
jgi:hypothetical protein